MGFTYAGGDARLGRTAEYVALSLKLSDRRMVCAVRYGIGHRSARRLAAAGGCQAERGTKIS
jgi:hypothetical protein